MRRAKTIWAAFWYIVLLCLTASAPSPAEEPVGRVEWVKGRLTLIHQGRRSFARTGCPLYEGDRLETGPFSRARLLLDGHRLEMGPGSTLLIAEVRHPERYRFFLWLGRLWLAVQDRLGLDFRVETPAAIAGVRGTVFAVAVAGDGTTIIGVEEGLVVVSMPSGEAEVEVPAGWEVTVKPGERPGPPKRTTGDHGEEGGSKEGKGTGPKGQGPQGGGGK